MKGFTLWLGIDRAVFFTLLGRGWNVGAGLLTIAVIAHFLSPEVQGYYYTFNSLVALQVFAELGLNFAIVQFASHEMAELSWQPNGTVLGEAAAKRRLQSLLHFTFVWFGGAAVLLILVLLPAGLYFFNAVRGGIIILPNIAIPWSLLVLLVAINFFINAAAAILEGCGKVAQIAVMRLWQSILAMTTTCISLMLGAELYALVASNIIMVIVGFCWLIIRYRIFFKDLIQHRIPSPGMSWRKEIWPFQWRIAVSWMSGYFIFQLFSPFLFKTHGPAAAGQMGMSLQIINAINGVAMVWIRTKAPIYGQLIASKQITLLNAIFKKGLIQSIVFLFMMIVVIWVIMFYLNKTSSPYAEKVLPLELLTPLLLICLTNHIVSSKAAYLRAYKKEPFLWVSVLSGGFTTVLAAQLIPPLGLTGAVYSYIIPNITIGFILGSVIFSIKSKSWANGHH